MIDLFWPAARALGDALLALAIWLPPLAGVLVLSMVCGALLLVLFRLLTPQAMLRRVKDRMAATVYEMRIFSASPGQVLAAQGRALFYTGAYLLLSLPSLVLLAPLLGLVLVRASTHYEYRPLEVGRSHLLSFGLDRPVPRRQIRVLPAADGLLVKPPLILTPSGTEGYIRVVARRPGAHRVVLAVGGSRVEKTIIAGTEGPVSPVRARPGSWLLLLSREPPLPGSSPVERVELDHLSSPLTWLALPWYIWVLLLSLAAALALRRRLGVVF